MEKEKRRSPRTPVAKGTRGQLKSTLAIEILNLSEMGLLLALSKRLASGASLERLS